MLSELSGDGVHRLENVITLTSVVHDYFDNLQLWFEPMVRPIVLQIQIMIVIHFMMYSLRTMTPIRTDTRSK